MKFNKTDQLMSWFYFSLGPTNKLTEILKYTRIAVVQKLLLKHQINRKGFRWEDKSVQLWQYQLNQKPSISYCSCNEDEFNPEDRLMIKINPIYMTKWLQGYRCVERIRRKILRRRFNIRCVRYIKYDRWIFFFLLENINF